MKKLLILILAMTFLFTLVATAEGEAIAEKEITITVDGKLLTPDTPPIIVDGRTMVPMRAVFEALGADVTWFPENQQIRAIAGSKIIDLKIDAPMLILCDVATGQINQIALDVAPFIKDSRTLVPVRAISEALGASVSWDGDNRVVTVVGAN